LKNKPKISGPDNGHLKGNQSVGKRQECLGVCRKPMQPRKRKGGTGENVTKYAGGDARAITDE